MHRLGKRRRTIVLCLFVGRLQTGPRRTALSVQSDTPEADIHATNASVMRVNKFGPFDRVLTRLESELQLLTHARDLLTIGENSGFAT